MAARYAISRKKAFFHPGIDEKHAEREMAKPLFKEDVDGRFERCLVGPDFPSLHEAGAKVKCAFVAPV